MQNSNVCLLNKNCTPCQGGVPPLSSEAVDKLLLDLGQGWVLSKTNKLYKKFNFNNFIAAISFANKIAKIAEQEAHHPDLTIAWGKCIVRIWTHKINGLTESDFILAAKIETI